MPDRRRISKLLSLILRHRPDEFGLNMDEYGYIPLEEVIEAVQQRYSAVEEQDIRGLIETSRQRRFEIVEDRIRALYGHSFYVEMDGEAMVAPELLYLCVPADQAERMRDDGIKSEDRFYLHLSPTREVAESRAGTVDDPTLVEVRAAAAASEAGIEFWERGEVVLTRQGIAADYVGETVPLEAPPASARDDGEEGERRPRRGRGRGGDRGRGDRGAERGGGDRGRPPRGGRPSRDDSRPSSTPAPAPQPVAQPEVTSWGRKPKFEKGSGRR